MPISRLPETTARELGSTLAVSTPSAVVKELLDNALDAGATFIDIIVSFDTLNRIEVRDNGNGIPTGDLDSLGCSGYTSKITTFDDVMALGGKSLGFRGVALASINTVAELTLTTKTGTDPVATMLQLSPGGGVASRRHVSAPVGTTVHVAKLFSRTPVREKVALRDAKKSLMTMKELLQAYALARPHVRLQFRVIRGDQTIPWSYTPKPQGDMKETVVQLFGTELASGCAERTFSTNQESSTGNDRRNNLIFEAYLPHSFADAIRVSKRAFVSVDSRPVSTKRGTLKKLYDIFKTHLSRAMSSSGQTELPKSPFIRLNIRCEPRSYDPNIEPSKDDVLFNDESDIINKFEQFMLSVYPPGPTPKARAEATLLTPSSTDPQQRNAQLPTESRNAHIKSGLTPVNPGAACKKYLSLDRGSRLENAAHATSSGPPTQAPSTSVSSQLLSAQTMIQEATREFRRFSNNPTPLVVSDMGIAQLSIGQGGLSRAILPIPQPGSEQNPSTERATILNSPGDADRDSIARRGNVDPRTASAENIRSSIEVIDQPRRPPIQIPHEAYSEHIQPIPSNRTAVVQNFPNLKAQPFVVYMSASFVDSDDEEAMPSHSAPRPGSHLVGGDKRQVHDDVEQEDPLEGLNPWSIAKLTASRRGPRQPLAQPLPQSVIEERESLGISERTRQPLPTNAALHQRRQCISNFKGPSHKRPFKVPGGPYKKPTFGQPSSRGPSQPTVQTTLSRFRPPSHLGHPPAGTDGGPIDSMSQPICSQPTGSLARLSNEDPRSYLLGDEQAVSKNPQRKLRRCKTDLLPLEKTPVGSETHRLILTLKNKTQDLARMLNIISDVDDYNREGKIERGVHDRIDAEKLQSLISRATAMMGE